MSVLQRIARGDKAAVDACIDQYGGLVLALARRHCGDPAEADDAVQDIFISLWRSAERFDPAKGSEVTFIATIARRRLIDRMRRRRRKASEVVIGPEVSENTIAAPSNGHPGQSGLESDEAVAAAQAALAELSENQQRVLRMSLVHGVSHEKIAEATGMPLGTVKTHIRRGLIRVREILNERATTHEVRG